MSMDYGWVGTVASWAGVGVAIILSWRTLVMQKRHHGERMRLEGLQMVYEILNKPEAIQARKSVYNAYYDYLSTNGKPHAFTYDKFKEHLAIDLANYYKNLEVDLENVRSAFEQIAVMAKNGIIDQETYFEAYWGTALRSYAAIHGHIEAIRIGSGTKHYSTVFQNQCDDPLMEYWKINHPDSKIAYYPSVNNKNSKEGGNASN